MFVYLEDMRHILSSVLLGAVGCGGMVGAGDAYRVDGISSQATLERPAGQGLVLRTSLPASVEQCRQLGGTSCTDDDYDGLTDEWEGLALDLLRPIVRLDEGEKLLQVASRTGMVGRVTPVGGG